MEDQKRVDWYLGQLDASIQKYTELRQRLKELASDSEAYSDAEGELRAWVLQVQLNATDAYGAIDRLTDEPIAAHD